VTSPRQRIGFIEMVRRANAPPPPEHSVTFRVATTVAVLVGIGACSAVGELSPTTSVLACVGTITGMVFSYLTRNHPWQWVKLLLAIAVIGVFGAFVVQVIGAAHTGELSSIEVPLAGLFTWVQVIHAFDVPARRDLLFSLAAAGALLTVAAAQAVSVGFLGYVGIWLGASLVALACSWRSMAGGRGPVPIGSVALSGVAVIVVGGALLTVLPAPRAAQSITLPSSLTSYLPLPDTTAITGGGNQSSEPAKPGRPGGRIGVGGYYGFAGALDTAVRGSLGNQVVLRVRADRPGYFLGETFDTWDGQSWLQSLADRATEPVTSGSPFDVAGMSEQLALQHVRRTPTTSPVPASIQAFSGPSNVQTFYVGAFLANLLFATSEPSLVYFPSHTVVVGGDGSIRSTVAMTPGTVYTVVSNDSEVAPAILAKVRASSAAHRNDPALRADVQLPPHRYAHVAALTRAIVRHAGATTSYAEVAALEAWMGRHVRYSTNIPPLLANQDAVDNFLFVTRKGYCEQISTALTVMLRTLHIPAREAIGYVPGPFDPLSNLYEIQAKDAHAWVQVWFPGYGWQNFDPTAQVPLSPADPGAVLLADVGRAIGRLPWVPIGGASTVLIAGELLALRARARRRRPTGWPERITLQLERRGARGGLPRRPAETLSEYSARLAAVGRWRAGPEVAVSLVAVAGVVERCAYAGHEPDAAGRAFVEQVVGELRAARGARRAPPVRGSGRLRPA
jgi:transglutaminase-like putative cysteine protease